MDSIELVKSKTLTYSLSINNPTAQTIIFLNEINQNDSLSYIKPLIVDKLTVLDQNLEIVSGGSFKADSMIQNNFTTKVLINDFSGFLGVSTFTFFTYRPQVTFVDNYLNPQYTFIDSTFISLSYYYKKLK